METKQQIDGKEKFFDGDFRKNPQTNIFCSYCQRDLDVKKIRFYAYITFINAPTIINPNFIKEYKEEFNRGEIQLYPIGSECAKKIGKSWLIKSEEVKQEAMQSEARHSSQA